MFSKSLSALAFGAIAITGAQAQGVGNAAAVKACEGFAPGSIKCLTDVSFVICRGGTGYEVEQFVAPGTHCEQGIPYQRKDAVNAPGIATATRVFVQNGPATASPPPTPAAPPPPPPASSTALPTSTDVVQTPAADVPPTADAPPAPEAPPAADTPPTADVTTSTTTSMGNSVEPITVAPTTFATALAE